MFTNTLLNSKRHLLGPALNDAIELNGFFIDESEEFISNGQSGQEKSRRVGVRPIGHCYFVEKAPIHRFELDPLIREHVFKELQRIGTEEISVERL